MLATGDLARWTAEGNIELLGRRDDQVKLRGQRLALGEVEAALLRTPGVQDAAAAIVDDVLRGFVVPAAVDINDVRQHAAAALPGYMVPSSITSLSALPRTNSGKLNRAALRNIPSAISARSVEPLTETEQILAGVWSELLEVEPTHRGQSFFELGGHSLLAARLVRRIDSTLGVRMPIGAVFATPTLEAMATAVDAGGSSTSTALELRGARSHVALLLAHPLGGGVGCYDELLRHLPADQSVWGLQSLGVASNAPEMNSVAAIAAGHVRDLSAAGCPPRVAVLGWSLGGLLALAVTEALEAAGVDVIFVEPWDCGLETERGPGEVTVLELTARALSGDRMFDQHSARALLRSSLAAGSDSVQAVCGVIGELCDVDVPAAEVDRVRIGMMNHLEAFRSWRPRGLRADIHAVYASDSLDSGAVTPTQWAALTTGTTTARVVEGTHNSLLTAPALNKALDPLVARLRWEDP